MAAGAIDDVRVKPGCPVYYLFTTKPGSHDETWQLLTQLNNFLVQEEIEQIIKEADSDGNGEVGQH